MWEEGKSLRPVSGKGELAMGLRVCQAGEENERGLRYDGSEWNDRLGGTMREHEGICRPSYVGRTTTLSWAQVGGQKGHRQGVPRNQLVPARIPQVQNG